MTNKTYILKLTRDEIVTILAATITMTDELSKLDKETLKHLKPAKKELEKISNKISSLLEK